MDRYAARQLEKKRLAEEKAQKALQDAIKPLDERLNRKQKDALNAVFGFPDPPKQVFALGKDKCAAVWWPYVVPEWVPPPEPEVADVNEELFVSPRAPVNPHEILSWQVHRYRKDRNNPNGEWLYKGFTVYTNLLKTQVVVEDLANDFEYRFEVKATNAKGTGSASRPSNPVMVEAPLPSGWFRFYDAEAHRHYYANVKLNKSRWDRPETDPYFLDESIHFNFQDNEIQALYRLYAEDIAHFNCVTVSQFQDILREVGEKCSRGWITKLFIGYAKNEEQLTSWTHFMEILNHIKKYRIKQTQLVSNPLSSFFMFFSRSKVKNIMKHKNFKMGDWRVEYSELASRYYYKNSVTGESHWSMPPQVKFYIPPKLEEKLLKVFDYGQIEEFQQYFSLLDVDNSGDLSDKEIKLLLNALNINLTEQKFQKLIKSVDLNGNGTIEFDEYCWMMYEINRKDQAIFDRDKASKNRPKARKKDPLGVEEEYDAADNSYYSNDVSIYNDKVFGGKLNFNTMKYTILNFRQGNNSGSSSRVASAFKSMRGLARSISIKGGHGIEAGQRRYSISSVDSNNTYQEPQRLGGLVRQMSTMISSRISGKERIGSTGHSSRLNSMLSKFDDTKLVDTSVAAIKRRKSLTFAATPSYDAAIQSARHAANAAALANDRYNREWEEEVKRQQAEEEWERQQEGKSQRSFGIFGYSGSSRRSSNKPSSPKTGSKPGSPKRASFVEEEKIDANSDYDDVGVGGVLVVDHPVEEEKPVKYSPFMNRYKPTKAFSLPFEWERDRDSNTAGASPFKKNTPLKIIRPPDYPPPDADPELVRKFVKMKRQKSKMVVETSKFDLVDELMATQSTRARSPSRSQKSAGGGGAEGGGFEKGNEGGSLLKPESPKSTKESDGRSNRAPSVHMLGALSRSGTMNSGTGLRGNNSNGGPPSRSNSFKRSRSMRSMNSEGGGDDNSVGGEGSDTENTPKSGSRRSSKGSRPGSFLRSLSNRILPVFGAESGDSDSSMDASGSAKKKPHPKHCMCGCRAF